jgi:hypothetical protein
VWSADERRGDGLTGGGYSYLTNFGLFSGRSEWGPRDNSLGRLFSGAYSTSDESCWDNTGFENGYFPTGLSPLASSDCPATWPAGVRGGDGEVTREGWKALFDLQGYNFRWDYWQVADSLRKTRPFLGTNFSTYGETSDHDAEILTLYGSVIPGGTGDPKIQGWPLGLVWRFEAFNFAIPSLTRRVLPRHGRQPVAGRLWRGTRLRLALHRLPAGNRQRQRWRRQPVL